VVAITDKAGANARARSGRHPHGRRSRRLLPQWPDAAASLRYAPTASCAADKREIGGAQRVVNGEGGTEWWGPRVTCARAGIGAAARVGGASAGAATRGHCSPAAAGGGDRRRRAPRWLAAAAAVA